MHKHKQREPEIAACEATAETEVLQRLHLARVLEILQTFSSFCVHRVSQADRAIIHGAMVPGDAAIGRQYCSRLRLTPFFSQ